MKTIIKLYINFFLIYLITILYSLSPPTLFTTNISKSFHAYFVNFSYVVSSTWLTLINMR